MRDKTKTWVTDKAMLERQLSAALSEVATLREENERLTGELRWVDATLARRPALDGVDRATKIERMCSVNGKMLIELADSQKKMDALIAAGRTVNRWYMHTTPEWNKDMQDAIDEFDAAIALAEERPMELKNMGITYLTPVATGKGKSKWNEYERNFQ